MAEILSQEEIDALLEVVDDNTDTPAPSNSKMKKMKEILSFMTLSDLIEFQKSSLERLRVFTIN